MPFNHRRPQAHERSGPREELARQLSQRSRTSLLRTSQRPPRVHELEQRVHHQAKKECRYLALLKAMDREHRARPVLPRRMVQKDQIIFCSCSGSPPLQVPDEGYGNNGIPRFVCLPPEAPRGSPSRREAPYDRTNYDILIVHQGRLELDSKCPGTLRNACLAAVHSLLSKNDTVYVPGRSFCRRIRGQASQRCIWDQYDGEFLNPKGLRRKQPAEGSRRKYGPGVFKWVEKTSIDPLAGTAVVNLHTDPIAATHKAANKGIGNE